MATMTAANGSYGALDPSPLSFPSPIGRTAITRLSSGGFVLAVNEFNGAYGVYFALFSRDGDVQIPRRFVSSGNTSDVAALPDGGFILTWTEFGANEGIRGQIFDSNGNVKGDSFAISVAGSSREGQVSIATFSSGGFVAAWTDLENGSDLVKMRYFDSTGRAISDEIVLSEVGPGRQGYFPQLATTSSGDVIATWQGSLAGPGGTTVILAIYDAQGRVIKMPEKLLIDSPDTPSVQSLAVLSDNRFVVTWTHDDRSGTTSVHGQIFTGLGVRIGTEFVVDPAVSVAALASTVASLDSGGFVVTWQSQTFDGGPNAFQRGDVLGRIYDAQGMPVGETFTANATTELGQNLPVVTSFGSNDYAIVFGDTFTTRGDYRIVARSFLSTINGGATDDNLAGTKDRDIIFGGAGDDFIRGSEGKDYIDGGSGDDVLRFDLRTPDRFTSTPGPRLITIQSDRIFDDLGKIDTTFANVERLQIGTDGTSAVTLGSLKVDGQSTNLDVRLSYDSEFTARLGGGNDYVSVGFRDATVDGGAGQDGVQVTALGGRMIVTGDTQSAIVTSVSGSFTRTVTLTSIERVTLFGEAMDSSGSSVPVRFLDTSSSQSAFGSRQNDIFVVGDDNRYSGVDDIWRGGGGADVFDFTYALGGIDGKHILDFDADDRLDFGFAEAGKPVPVFVADGVFTGRAGEYRARGDGAKTFVEADYNGDRIVDRTLTIENGAFELRETSLGSNSLVIGSILASDAADVLTGTAGGETIDGRGGSDRLDLTQGGDDRALGGDGDDGIFFGATFTAADFVDGGAGTNDQLVLQGNYAAGLSLGAAQVVGTEVIVALPGFGYSLTTRDELIAAGATMIFYAAQLGAGDAFSLDGRAESDGAFTVYGGRGADTIRTGAGIDLIAFGPGGFDPARDLVDGGGGSDRVLLDGSYAITLSGTNLVNVETVELAGGPGDDRNVFAITLADSFAPTGAARTVTGAGVTTALTIDGSAEASAALTLVGGSAGDELIGGGGADVLRGGMGGDVLTGGAGGDTFAYASAAESTGAGFDRLLDLDLASDRIDLPGAITSFDPTRYGGTLTTATFDADMASLARSLAANGAMIVTGARGDFNGRAFLVADGNGVAGYQAGADHVFEVPATIGAIPLAVFV